MRRYRLKWENHAVVSELRDLKSLWVYESGNERVCLEMQSRRGARWRPYRRGVSCGNFTSDDVFMRVPRDWTDLDQQRLAWFSFETQLERDRDALELFRRLREEAARIRKAVCLSDGDVVLLNNYQRRS